MDKKAKAICRGCFYPVETFMSIDFMAHCTNDECIHHKAVEVFQEGPDWAIDTSDLHEPLMLNVTATAERLYIDAQLICELPFPGFPSASVMQKYIKYAKELLGQAFIPVRSNKRMKP